MKSVFATVCVLLVLPFSVVAQTAAPAPGAPVPNSPADLPGKGLAQHDFLYCGEWNHIQQQQTMWLIRDGKPVWSYSIPLNVVFNNKADIEELGDCTQLSNGNIVFFHATGRCRGYAGQADYLADHQSARHRDALDPAHRSGSRADRTERQPSAAPADQHDDQ
jgi:hypothetical protein